MRHAPECPGQCEPVCAGMLKAAQRDAKSAAASYCDLERRVRWIGDAPWIEAFGTVTDAEAEAALAALPPGKRPTVEAMRTAITTALRYHYGQASPKGAK